MPAATNTTDVPRKISLEVVSIASPCPADWNEMAGGDRVRHCAQCDLDVYNLSGMSRVEAEALIESHSGQGRMCIRMHRRQDGTVITQDCPVGLAAKAAAAARWVRVKTMAAAVAIAGMTQFGCSDQTPSQTTKAPQAQPMVTTVAAGQTSSQPDPFEMMGRACSRLVDRVANALQQVDLFAGNSAHPPMVMGEMMAPESEPVKGGEVLIECEGPAGGGEVVELMGDVAFPLNVEPAPIEVEGRAAAQNEDDDEMPAIEDDKQVGVVPVGKNPKHVMPPEPAIMGMMVVRDPDVQPHQDPAGRQWH